MNNGEYMIKITEAEARKIAHANASQVYRDLSLYKIESELKDGIWYVDYWLDNSNMVGGGPHFTISGTTGEILSYRFDQ